VFLTKPGSPTNVVPFPAERTRRDKRILKFMPLVDIIAKRIAKTLPPSFDLDDLRGPGFVGLVEGIDSFKAGRGCTLKVHVSTCIDRAIKDSSRRRNRKDATHEPPEAADHIVTPIDLDQAIDQRKASHELSGALESLDARERKVIHLIYVREQGTQEIGDSMGIHNSNVSRIHHGALGRLRRHYALRGRRAA